MLTKEVRDIIWRQWTRHYAQPQPSLLGWNQLCKEWMEKYDATNEDLFDILHENEEHSL